MVIIYFNKALEAHCISPPLKNLFSFIVKTQHAPLRGCGR